MARLSAQFEPVRETIPDRDANVRGACERAGPTWQRGGKHFERARGIVARKLGWSSESVLDWEVRSYFRLDRPAWIARAGLVFE